LQQNTGVYLSPPAVLQPAHEFALLYQDAQGATLQSANAVGAIFPGTEDTGPVGRNLLGGPSAAPEDGEGETSE
jgi:hypothetical protein